MRLRFVVPAIALAALPLSSLPAQTAVAARRVVDGAGQVHQNAVVVIEGSRIRSVGPRASFSGRVVDLGDVTLTPGLIDVHTHVTWYFNAQGRYHTSSDGETPAQAMLAAAGNLYATLMSGVTTTQSLGSPEDKDLRDAVQRGVIPGPRLITSLGSLSERTGNPAMIRQRVREFKQSGADVIKIFASASIRDGGGPTMTAEQLAAACGEAHAQGLRAVVHAHAAAAMKLAVEAGCDQIEHGIFATQEVLDLMAQRGTYLSAQCGLVFRNYLDNRARFEGIGNYNAEGFAAMEREMPRGIEAIRKANATRGLKMLFGTDAVAGAHGRNVEDLICRASEAGQRPLDVITIATSLAAQSLRMDSLGVIAPGKVADLAAFAGDVTTDITALRRPVFVMQGGRIYRNDTGGSNR